MSERETESADRNEFKDLYIEHLQEAYWLEKRLVRTLLKFQDIAHTTDVKQVFAELSEQTKTHVSRLELLFNLISLPTSTKIYPIISDIADSWSRIALETKAGTSTRDVQLTLAAQRAASYETRIYTKLIELANVLRNTDAIPILYKTLQEKRQAIELFLHIAKDTTEIKM